MPVTPWVPTVRTIKDGEPVDQATVNVPLDQMIQREQHLYEKFDELAGKSVLLAIDQPIYPGELVGDSPLQNGKLDVVYFRSDENGSGIAKGKTGFASSSTKGMYVPNKSNYTFGIVKSVSSGGKADLYIEGLCELPVDLDDPTNGLIESELGQGGVRISEEFEVGPYYLSRKYPGKITKNPAGIPIYVGYALSKRRFLLQPAVEEFSQFFINYRYNVLDRPVAAPVLVDGYWTIPTPDGNPNRLGWIEAKEELLPGYTIAEDPATGRRAKFFYYIPTNLLDQNSTETDALSYNEKVEANELRSLLPPIPSNFVELTVNGVSQGFIDGYSTTGIYKIDDYGLWWFEDAVGLQPWSNDLTEQEWTPDDWPTSKGSDNLRPRLFISFAKFNPAVRTQLVSSLRPYNNLSDSLIPDEDKNNSEPFIQFFTGKNLTEQSPTGDLYVRVTPQFLTLGATQAGNTELPTNQDQTYRSGKAVADLSYNPVVGKFHKVITPVVSELVGLGGINVTEIEEGTGRYAVSYLTNGIYGSVDSIEPINSRLEFRGLNSYIKLPYANPVTVQYGLIGKIILTKGTITNVPLQLTLQVFGDQAYEDTSSDRQISLSFEYSATTAQNSSADAATKEANNVVGASGVNAGTVDLSLTASGNGYTAYTPVNVTGDLVIPAGRVAEDTVINFKLIRGAGQTNNYAGSIGILGIYWGINNAQ